MKFTLAIVLLLVFPVKSGVGQVTRPSLSAQLPLEDIRRWTLSHCLLSSDLEKTSTVAEQQSILAATQAYVDKYSGEYLDDHVRGQSELAIKLVAESPIRIAFEDDEYIKLAVRVHFANIKLRLLYQSLVPPISDKEHSRLHVNVEQYTKEISIAMSKILLIPPIGLEQSDIDDFVSGLKYQMSMQIETPDAKGAKRSLTNDQVESLSREFADRLSESQTRAHDLLAKALDHDKTLSEVSAVKNAKLQILAEIRSAVLSSFYSQTVDPSRNLTKTDDMCPGYDALVIEFAKKQKMLVEILHRRKDSSK